MTNSHFGNSNGWPDEGVTYHHRPRPRHARRSDDPGDPRPLQELLQPGGDSPGARRWAAAQPITQGNRNPLLGQVAGADGLKTGHTEEAGYGFTGSAEQDGRRLIMVVAGLGSFNQRIEESVKFMDWGFRAWKSQPLFSKGEKVADAKVQLAAATTVGRWSRRATSRSPCRRARPATSGSRSSMTARSRRRSSQGPAYRRPRRHDRRHAAADHAAGRRRGGRRGRLLRPDLGRPDLAVRLRTMARGRFITPRRRGGGRQVDPAEAPRRGASRARPRGGRDARARRKRGRGGDPEPAARRRATTAGPRRPKPCCSPPRAPTMSPTRSGPPLERGDWVLSDRFLDSSLAYQGGAGGIGIEAVRRLHEIGSDGFLPDRTLLLELPAEAAAERAQRSRRRRARTGSAGSGRGLS